MGKAFLINRNDIRQTKFKETAVPTDLNPGEVLFKIDQFAFTANNVTYAATGEYLNYWGFFPVDEAGWGKLPVWGFADVIASTHDDIAVGERIYGYWPLATHLRVTAVKVTPSGFLDGAPHRQELNAVYNYYVRAQNNPGFSPQAEHLNSLLRPMFTTSFLVDDFLDDNEFFGAKTLILSSASSKTGYGTAFMHFNRRPQRTEYQIIGLTSSGNIDFVESLGCYDRVLAYEEVGQLDHDEAAVYVDFSGNGRLRHTIHTHFGDNLKYDCAIGLTAWEMQGSNRGLPGVPATFFFAPAQIQKRRHEWGAEMYQTRLNQAFADFLAFAADQIDIEVREGETAVQQIYQAMLDNKADPNKGYILTLQ